MMCDSTADRRESRVSINAFSSVDHWHTSQSAMFAETAVFSRFSRSMELGAAYDWDSKCITRTIFFCTVIWATLLASQWVLLCGDKFQSETPFVSR